MYSRSVLESKVGHEKKKKGKENQRIRKLPQTLNCLIQSMVYSQRGPGEAEPSGPEGASHMVDQMTTSIPPCLLRVFPPVIG